MLVRMPSMMAPSRLGRGRQPQAERDADKKRHRDEWKTPQAHAETRIGHFYSSVNRPTPSLGDGSRAGAVTKTSQSSKLRELGYSGVKARESIFVTFCNAT